MTAFQGVLSDFGIEKSIILYVDNGTVGDVFYDNCKYNAKIDGIACGNTRIKNNNTVEEKTLREGMFVKANAVIGEIDEEDKMEYDF